MSVLVPSFRPARPHVVAGAALFFLAASGCDALARLEDGGATVFVFSTHHATPEDGVFPFRGDDEMPRQFLNDEGWEITLLESYVTISAVTLVNCNGDQLPLDMFWGPCPEDMRSTDLETVTVAGKKARPGNFCSLLVEYGPYTTPTISDEGESSRHQTPDNESVEGATIYLRGGARLDGGENIDFELRATGTTVVELDLSALEGPGKPMNVGQKENFPKELLVSKTYDRFFDGIDFETYDADEHQDGLLDTLDLESQVQEGTTVQMQ